MHKQYVLQSVDVPTPPPKPTDESKPWEVVLRLKEKNEQLSDQLKEVVRLVKGCQYGEDKHTIQMLRELLGVE